MTQPILVVEDDFTIRGNVVEILTEEGFEVIAADNGADGIALAKARRPRLIICDIMMPGIDGYEVLKVVRGDSRVSGAPFIFLTAKSDRADVRAGMNLGADDYLIKPFTLSDLLSAVKTRLERLDELSTRLRDAAERESNNSAALLAEGLSPAEGVVVANPTMRAIYAQAARAAASQISVLILGETGVGKEVFARAIHNLSQRSGPFLALNCGALTESLLESELFGHEKGAFTGAHQSRPGLFESAARGTVFLDEVGELPLSIQAKLLRVLEERKVLRVGGRTPKEVDVRFLAATNRDLEAEIKKGTFREDLFYRLCGISFTVPPLRERLDELRALARMFVARASAEHGRTGSLDIAPETDELLLKHPWPGNVRELKNVVARGVLLCQGNVLLPEHLPPQWSQAKSDSSSDPTEEIHRQYQQALIDLDRRRVGEALERTGGNQTAAAELLGMSRRTLVYRLNALGLPRPRKRV